MKTDGFKKFKEVFPGIELDDDINEYFDDVEVTRVEMVSSTTTIYVRIQSKHLIARPNIKKAEEALNENEQAYDGMLAFDIHFENAAGEEIEPNGKVTVKFAAKSEVLSDIAPDKVDTDSIQIVHIVETPAEEKPAESMAI